MYKLILNNQYVVYVQKMENKNSLKLLVVIIYVYNVLKNYLNKKNKIIVQNVENKIGLLQLMIININNILIIFHIIMNILGEYILIQTNIYHFFNL